MPWLVVGLLMVASGCQTFDFYSQSLKPPLPAELEPPSEQSPVSLPAYRIEPPDILQIEVLKLVPRPPYRIQIYDVLSVRVVGTLLDNPIDNYYIVGGEGEVSLGPIYGRVRVGGLTIEEAQQAITNQLKFILRAPAVSVQLARTGGTQEITGTYLVRQDGSINLREYGVVPVAGKTIIEAKVAIERRLAEYYDTPEVSVNVIGYNSKVYFVILENTAAGEAVIRIPITGNETVLDAIGNIGGLGRPASTRIWIARPVPGRRGCEQILPVDYLAVSRGGQSTTNYQLLPDDRLYIAEDGLVAANNVVGKVISPVRQLFGITELGAATIQNLQKTGRAYNLNLRVY